MNRLTLPLPISSNAAWTPIVTPKKDDLLAAVAAYLEGNAKWRDVLKTLRARLISTEAYREWKHVSGLPLAAQRTEVLEGGVKVEATFFFPSRRGDMPNRPKVLLDLLQGLCYTNDSQVWEVHFWREIDKENPRVEVTVTALAPELFTADELEEAEHLEF